jgi:hypothetical protein
MRTVIILIATITIVISSVAIIGSSVQRKAQNMFENIEFEITIENEEAFIEFMDSIRVEATIEKDSLQTYEHGSQPRVVEESVVY